MADGRTKLQQKITEKQKTRALWDLSNIAKYGNENLTSKETEAAIIYINTLTNYVTDCTFYSHKSRQEKYEDCKKFGKELLYLKVIDLCCKTIVRSKSDLPKIKHLTSSVLEFMWLMTNYLQDICDKVMNYSGLLDYFKTFLEGVIKPLNKGKLSTDNSGKIIVIAGIIHNCCTCYEGVVATVRKTKILDVLKEILKSPRTSHESIVMALTATVADIMDEDDSESFLPDGNDARIVMVIDHLNKSLIHPTGSYDGRYTFELCRVIRQLASYDSNKKRLVDLGVLKALVRAAKYKDDYTQQEAVKALSHLSFDAECQKKMIEERENETAIDTLIDLAKSSDEKIRETSYGALWTMYGNLRTSKKYAEKVESVFMKTTKGHVMISYSHQQKEILLNIRKRLEQENFIVWMDVDQMRGDVYDRMAEAVENASAVLLGMSRSYKMSEYCRREAAYARKLNKQIIPLKVERDYDPDGWLGFMTAGMFFYDYGSLPFGEMCTKLTQELNRKDDTGNVPEVKIKGIADAHGYSVPQQMISRQVLAKGSVEKFKKFNRNAYEKWLDKYNLPRDRFETLRPQDILYLASMKQEAPEAYYTLSSKLFEEGSKELRKIPLVSGLTEALNEFL